MKAKIRCVLTDALARAQAQQRDALKGRDYENAHYFEVEAKEITKAITWLEGAERMAVSHALSKLLPRRGKRRVPMVGAELSQVWIDEADDIT